MKHLETGNLLAGRRLNSHDRRVHHCIADSVRGHQASSAPSPLAGASTPVLTGTWFRAEENTPHWRSVLGCSLWTDPLWDQVCLTPNSNRQNSLAFLLILASETQTGPLATRAPQPLQQQLTLIFVAVGLGRLSSLSFSPHNVLREAGGQRLRELYQSSGSRIHVACVKDD